MCPVARSQRYTEGTFSGFQDFFLQPIIKESPNMCNLSRQRGPSSTGCHMFWPLWFSMWLELGRADTPTRKGSKSTSSPILKLLALETIDSYPNTNIKAFTDCSAVRAVRNGGYRSLIMIPSKGEPALLSGPCVPTMRLRLLQSKRPFRRLDTLIQQFETTPNRHRWHSLTLSNPGNRRTP